MITNNPMYDQQEPDHSKRDLAISLGYFGADWALGAASKHGWKRAGEIEDKYKFSTTKSALFSKRGSVYSLGGEEGILKAAQVKLGDAALKNTIMSEGRKAFMYARGAQALGRISAVMDFAFLAPMLFGAVYSGFKGIQRMGYELEAPSHRITLSTAAFTDRQRAMQKMFNVEYQGRSALGLEGFLYHR